MSYQQKSFDEMMKLYLSGEVSQHKFWEWYIMKVGGSFSEGFTAGKKAAEVGDD